jgi:hypothetical protein
MHAAIVPGVGDLTSLLGYVLRDPYLFISSSTVMTSALVTALALLAAAAIRLRVARGALARLAGPLVLVFAYFGLGSLVLSLEILVRFHAELPFETETQLVSGVGHLVLGAIGALIALPFARGHTDWLLAHAVALLYWTLQVLVLDPPWFAFQGQHELIRLAALATLAAGTLLTAVAAAARPYRGAPWTTRSSTAPSKPLPRPSASAGSARSS